ncbi:hypothetical protein COLO4_13483 [Corchorus olitorius]|uniref:Uncharacterized GPI-anchored protein At5g19230-like domain-containing protein n=1 Tax=Corchorus olitorius TaxID=93759 RepID=A0A1R3JWE5_9ROSI|nr:hypothetical protein COLO4_13483 [Corchorus olitorius]
MASLKFSHFLLVVVLPIFLLSHPVHSDDEEDHLLQGLNSFRTSGNLPAFTKVKNAHCAAEKIANDLEDTPCTNPSTSQGKETKLSDYPKAISKCNIDPNTTNDVLVLPVCVPHLVPTLLLTNFTRTHFSKYINDSTYTGIGLSTEDDWMVVVFASNTPSGSLANRAFSLVNAKGFGIGHYLVLFLLGLVLGPVH